MRRQNILKILAEHRSEIESRFGVASLSLFGSAARDEAAAESDVDILLISEKDGNFYTGSTNDLKNI